MATHSPEGAAVAKFIEHENGSHGPWMVRVVEEPNSPTLLVEAWRDNEVETHPAKSLEVDAEKLQLFDDELNEGTKTTIRQWLASL